MQDIEADEREIFRDDQAKLAHCEGSTSSAASAARVPNQGCPIGGSSRTGAQERKHIGWLGKVRLSNASSHYKLVEVRGNAASSKFDPRSTGLDRSVIHETSPAKALVSYVGWVSCFGSEMARRPRMMDQCGALARSLGRPCHGIERFDVWKRYTAGKKEMSSSIGLSSSRGLNDTVAPVERSCHPDETDSEKKGQGRGSAGIQGFAESLQGRPDVAFYYIVMGLALIPTLVSLANIAVPSKNARLAYLPCFHN